MKRRRLQNVISAVCNTPWLILPEKLQQIRHLLALRAQGIRLTSDQIRARIGATNAPQTVESRKQVTVLNLFGTISHRANFLSEFSGGTSTEVFGKFFDEAVADPDVIAIVILADTPGGSVPGVMELSNKIYAARAKKRIITVIDPMMASAGLWIGTAASEVVASPSANQIGSVGCLLIHDDDTEALADAGIDRTIIATSEFKGELWQTLTDSAKAHLRAQCDEIHKQFVDALARNCGVSVAHVETNFGRGRTMNAAQAMAAGIVHRIATLDEVLAELGVSSEPSAGGTTGVHQTAATPPGISKDASTMNKKILTRLIRAGLVDAECTAEQYNAALGQFFADRKLTAPTGDEAIIGAIDTAIAMEGRQAGTAGAGTATPTTAGTGTTTQTTTLPVASDRMGMADVIASINLTSLNPQQRLDLQGSLLPQISTLTTAQVLDRINQAVVANSPSVGSGTVRNGAAEQDKFHAAARDAILMRRWGGDAPAQIFDSRTGQMVAFNGAAAARDYSLQSPLRIAARVLVQAGIPQSRVDQLAPMELAQLMTGVDAAQMGFLASDGPAYNVSGMFSNILFDASNVLLRRSYMDARTTFQIWMRRAESIPNFKPVHKVIAGELGDPRAIPENGAFEEVTMADGKEKYQLVVWGEMFSCSWQLIANDDLGSFMEVDQKMGRAMKRKQNRLAYGPLRDNPTMADTGALFNSTAITTAGGHNNLATGAITTRQYGAQFSTMTKKMRQQRGLDPVASSALNIAPEFVIFPSAIRDEMLYQLGSDAEPSAGHSGVTNIYQRAFTPIEEEEIGAGSGGSDTAFYLAANSGDVDTLEYAYLQGLESPRLEQAVSFDRLAIRKRIYQAFAVKAIDYRGLQKHAGA